MSVPSTVRAAEAPERPYDIASRLLQVRDFSMELAAALSPEDSQVQSMPDASPAKWHLAHTSWFFETFLLSAHLPGYKTFDPSFGYLFNSYYNSVGTMHPRPQRGLVTRPTLAQVKDYRAHVDSNLQRLMERADLPDSAWSLLELGRHHEQQHQELLLTDIKHAFSLNPLQPAYRAKPRRTAGPTASPVHWQQFDEAIIEIGGACGSFAFDNERPRHRVLVQPYTLASRPVTNAEYLEFIRDGGYRQPTLWLSNGWATLQAEGWERPMYWSADEASCFTLHGTQPIDPDAPVCHLSYFEADAFARWAGARLPREVEWERAAAAQPVRGHFVESGDLHPQSAMTNPDSPEALQQLFGDVWEWTQSPYVGYPGYQPPAGAVGEYNGKFMCDQWVLRGGSCASAQSHLRASYRNFFPAPTRWQFTGLRLARDL